MNQKGFINIIFGVVVIVLISIVGYLVFLKKPPSIVEPITQVNCGSVGTHGSNLPSYDKDVQKIEDCFWTNFKSGVTASLILHYMGVDTGSNLYFFTECGSGKCKISGYGQSYSANFGGSKSTQDPFTCTDLTKDAHGLHALQCKFKGSTRDILIPAYSDQFDTPF